MLSYLLEIYGLIEKCDWLLEIFLIVRFYKEMEEWSLFFEVCLIKEFDEFLIERIIFWKEKLLILNIFEFYLR